MSHTYSSLSLGEYLVMTIVPLILLAGWGIAMYRADKQPEWRRAQHEYGPPRIPGAAGVQIGRAVPGTLPVEVEPESEVQEQPDRRER